MQNGINALETMDRLKADIQKKPQKRLCYDLVVGEFRVYLE